MDSEIDEGGQGRRGSRGTKGQRKGEEQGLIAEFPVVLSPFSLSRSSSPPFALLSSLSINLAGSLRAEGERGDRILFLLEIGEYFRSTIPCPKGDRMNRDSTYLSPTR